MALVAAINREYLAAYPTGLRRSKEKHTGGYVICRTQAAHGNALHQCTLAVGAIGLSLIHI